MKIHKGRGDGDLHLVALLTAKILKDEYSIDDAPALSDFVIVPDGARYPDRPELRLNVDLGRKVSFRIDHMWSGDGDRDVADLVETAEHLAEHAARAIGDASEIRGMLSEVRHAVKREMAKASKRGLPYRLVSVELLPMAVHFSDGAVVGVEVEVLGRSLQLHRFAFEALSAEDVTAEFEGLREEQEERAGKRSTLDRMGATGLIDAVLLASMRHAGVDVRTVLSHLKEEEWIVDAPDADDRTVTLHWDEGIVYGHVALEDGIKWHQGRIHFDKPAFAGADVKGRPLSVVLKHPFVDGDLLVRSGSGAEGKSATLHCETPLLRFNSDSGEIWAG